MKKIERRFLIMFGIPIFLLLGILICVSWPIIVSVLGKELWYGILEAAGMITYLFIGFRIAQWYGGKIDEFEKEIISRWQEEFSMWRTGTWTFLMFILWPLLWPYEYYTDFRRWNVNYRISDQY